MSYLANGESRDIQCAADVGRMAALGRFDEELLRLLGAGQYNLSYQF